MSTLPQATLLSLSEYVAACLDATQQATRESLVLAPLPPSGQGSEHDTIPAPYGVEGVEGL